MKKNVLMIVNPVAGDNDKSQMIESVRNLAAEREFGFEAYETTGQDDITKIKKLYLDLGPNKVFIAGGDGTIKMVAEALEGEDVVFGILASGSANGLSVDLDLPTTFEENLEIVFGDHFMEMDMLCINGKRSLHLSDLGLNANLVMNYENSGVRGKIGYALQAVSTLVNRADPFTAEIIANGQTYSCDAHMIIIANSQKYGTGVIINPNGKINDGKFEIVILKNFDLSIFGKFISGDVPDDKKDFEIISADKAIITTQTPVHFQIDGEYIGEESKLEIYVLARQVRFASLLS